MYYNDLYSLENNYYMKIQLNSLLSVARALVCDPIIVPGETVELEEIRMPALVSNSVWSLGKAPGSLPAIP